MHILRTRFVKEHLGRNVVLRLIRAAAMHTKALISNIAEIAQLLHALRARLPEKFAEHWIVLVVAVVDGDLFRLERKAEFTNLLFGWSL